MVTIFRNVSLSLAALVSVFSFLPAVAFAQTATAQVNVITQSSYNTNGSTGTVTVTGSGPSLSSVPTSNSTLSFSSSFNGDSRVVTFIPGNYSIYASNNSGQSVSYSSECSGTLYAGQTRTCIITANTNTSGQGNARVNVSVNVINSNGGNRVAGDFTVNVSGSGASVSTFAGTPGTTQVSLGNGGYSIDVQNPGSYSVSRSSDCSGTIYSGDTRSCLITLTQYGSGYSNGGTYYMNGSTCYYGTNYPVGSICYNGNSNNNYYNNNSGSTYYMNGNICYYGNNYPVGSSCYNGGVNQGFYGVTGPLTCAPSVQTVDNGQTASFTAFGASGPFTWTVGGRSFFAVGPQLNTVVPNIGTQTVQVSNGIQTASCIVTVTNKHYVGGVVLGASTVIPGLPNTGSEPSTTGLALALLGALVALPLALLMAYPYAKRTAVTLFR